MKIGLQKTVLRSVVTYRLEMRVFGLEGWAKVLQVGKKNLLLRVYVQQTRELSQFGTENWANCLLQLAPKKQSVDLMEFCKSLQVFPTCMA